MIPTIRLQSARCKIMTNSWGCCFSHTCSSWLCSNKRLCSSWLCSRLDTIKITLLVQIKPQRDYNQFPRALRIQSTPCEEMEMRPPANDEEPLGLWPEPRWNPLSPHTADITWGCQASDRYLHHNTARFKIWGSQRQESAQHDAKSMYWQIWAFESNANNNRHRNFSGFNEINIRLKMKVYRQHSWTSK